MFAKYRDKKGHVRSPRMIREKALTKVDIPDQNKTVLRTKEAYADGEHIGQSVFYDDGTIDFIVKDGISEKARRDLEAFKVMWATGDLPENYTLPPDKEVPDGATEQE